MNGDFYEEDYPDERKDVVPTAEEIAAAAAFREEQRQKTINEMQTLESVVGESLPTQGGAAYAASVAPGLDEAIAREQASDYASWVAGGRRAGDIKPILPLKYGARMPTSQGYMYIGTGSPNVVPPMGTPEHQAATISRLATPEVRPLGPTDIGFDPIAMEAQRRFDAQQSMRQAIASGVPESVAVPTWAPLIVPSGGRTGYPASSLRSTAPIVRDVAGILQEYDPVTRTVRPMTSPVTKRTAKETPEYLIQNTPEYKNLLAQEKAIVQGQLKKEIKVEDAAKELNRIRWEKERLMGQIQQGGTQGAAVTPPRGATMESSRSMSRRIGTRISPVPVTTATPRTPLAKPAMALPRTKSDLIKGQRYNINNRTWEWDGTKLVAVD